MLKAKNTGKRNMLPTAILAAWVPLVGVRIGALILIAANYKLNLKISQNPI